MLTSFSKVIYVFDGKLTALSIYLKHVLYYVAPPEENYCNYTWGEFTNF